MYVENLKKDFYEFLAAKRILLIANYDIDSVCTCKILQPLLKLKYCLYTLEVVKGISDLKRVYQENCENVKYFVLINCGGTIDLLECLEPEEDIIFFVLDSHRPTDVYNIYNDSQVRLLWTPEEDLNVPKLEDIFIDDSDESENEDENSDNDDNEEGEGERSSKRQKLEEKFIKRRQRRLWEENRENILNKYSQYSYFTSPSAITTFKLAWVLSKDDKDLLWYAVVALAEQDVLFKIETANYVLESGELQSHANNLRNRTLDNNVATAVKIEYEKDVKLPLYRHWTVENSLRCSIHSCCALKLWLVKGELALQELFVEMGLPLNQSRQNYSSMDLELRQEFLSQFEKCCDKLGLSEIIYSTFTLSYGYRNKFCASDYVYAMIAILDDVNSGKKPDQQFLTALDCLSRTKNTVLYSAVEDARGMLSVLFETVKKVIVTKRIILAGPFVYYIIEEGVDSWQMLSQPHIVFLLAQFLLRAYVASSKNRKAKTLPFVISAPSNLSPGMCVVLGIPPLCEGSTKNVFGAAFQQIATNINCDTYAEFFDTAYVHIQIKDRSRFLDGITATVG